MTDLLIAAPLLVLVTFLAFSPKFRSVGNE
mgnify:CR=1 FL=1